MKKQFSQRAGITMGLGLVSLLIGFMLLSACAVSPEQDRGRERAAIEQAIHAAIGWAKNKDFKQLYSVIANDSAYLEVDPENRVVKGFAEFRQAEKFWGSPNFKAIRYEIRDLKINLSNSGTVAWFYAVLDDINEWRGQPACWQNTRWTGVLEKRGGHWVIVQMHFSFATDQ